MQDLTLLPGWCRRLRPARASPPTSRSSRPAPLGTACASLPRPMARLVSLTLLILCCCPAVAVAALPPVNHTRPVIHDTTPVVGDTLHAAPGEWDDPQAIFAYQWLACDGDGKACADIPDATSDTYTVLASDISKRLQVRTTATNADGAGVPSDSLLTGVVLDVAPAPD